MNEKPNVPPELDLITDVVLAYRPNPKTKAAKRRNRKKKREAKKEAQAVIVPQSDPDAVLA
jgi:hypothetical protein